MSAKVLFVDDQEEILELIKIKLAGELYEKFYAENATEAMKLVESEGIDVSVALAYQLGGKVYDNTYSNLMHSGYGTNAGRNWHLNRLLS